MICVLPDTNILLNDPRIVLSLIAKKYSVIISMTVLDELDKFKNKAADIGYKAREAFRVIDRERNNPLIILTAKYAENPILKFNKGDGCIQSTALYYKQCGEEVIILSEDTGMRLSAQALGVKTAKNIAELDKVIDQTKEKAAPAINSMNENLNLSDICFGNHGVELIDKVQQKLGSRFTPKYNKSGVTFFSSNGRILKLVYAKSRLHVEFNVPVSQVNGLTVLTKKEAQNKNMGTCQWIYKGDSVSTVLDLVEEAVKKY
ncbi:MAG: PIN domain-containing protein [Bacillota bacterium]